MATAGRLSAKLSESWALSDCTGRKSNAADTVQLGLKELKTGLHLLVGH